MPALQEVLRLAVDLAEALKDTYATAALAALLCTAARLAPDGDPAVAAALLQAVRCTALLSPCRLWPAPEADILT